MMGREAVESDAFLVERIAAVSDRNALAELRARHGMTLYAIAYTVAFDPAVADAAVAAAFREVWLSAASFDARQGNVRRWLVDLTRHIACRQLREPLRTRSVPLLFA